MICTLHPDDGSDSNSNDAPDEQKTKQSEPASSSPAANEQPLPAGQGTSEQQPNYAYQTKKPSPKTRPRTESWGKRRASASADLPVTLQTIADCGKHLDYFEASRYRIGVIIQSTQTCHGIIAAIASPASSCRVTAVALLHLPESFRGFSHVHDPNYLSDRNLSQSFDDDEQQPQKPPDQQTRALKRELRKWMASNNLGNHAEPVDVLAGQEGAEELVQRDDVDAVFVLVPAALNQRFVLSGLEAGKHVLYHDPVSVSLPEFQEQLQYAERYGKFVQSSTAFVHQYRVQHFMDCVLREQQFGRVISIDANLSLSPHDLHLVGVHGLPLAPGEGCIRRLGRYCALFAILLFGRIGSRPTSVQVHKVEYDKSKRSTEDEGDSKMSLEPSSATCTVNFTKNLKLTFKVEYSSASTTRQNVEVRTESSYASMTDFVFCHPDGLATYRVYQDITPKEVSGDMQVLRGEAIDIAGGPTHEVMVWRKFTKLSRSVDEVGCADSPAMEPVRELADVTHYTKKVLNALMKSCQEGLSVVELDQ